MDIQTELLNLLLDTVDKTKLYLDVFEVTDTYLFSANEEKRAEIKKSFTAFSSYLVSTSESADSLTSKISAMVCNADDDMNNELTSYYSNILENYFLWRAALLSFLDNSGSMILNKNDEFKSSLLISYAQSFLTISENLIGILNIK